MPIRTALKATAGEEVPAVHKQRVQGPGRVIEPMPLTVRLFHARALAGKVAVKRPPDILKMILAEPASPSIVALFVANPAGIALSE